MALDILKLLVFGLPKGNHWQICKECADREIRLYGTSYWPRSDQFMEQQLRLLAQNKVLS